MNTIKNYIALSLSVLVLGCTSYPEHGTGGLAESYDPMNYQNTDFSPVMPDEPLGPEHGLRFDWQLAKLHLDALIQEGARWCFPAAVVQAIEKQNRIARELAELARPDVVESGLRLVARREHCVAQPPRPEP